MDIAKVYAKVQIDACGVDLTILSIHLLVKRIWCAILGHEVGQRKCTEYRYEEEIIALQSRSRIS